MLYVPKQYVFRAIGKLPRKLRLRLVRAASVTASMSAGCHVEHGGRILQVRAAYRDWFSIPGGLLARGEGPEAGAVREVREEAGIDVVITGQPAVFFDPSDRRMEFIYPARLADGVRPEDAHAASPEIAELRWVSVEVAQAPEEDPQGFNRAMMHWLANGGGMMSSTPTPPDHGAPGGGG